MPSNLDMLQVVHIYLVSLQPVVTCFRSSNCNTRVQCILSTSTRLQCWGLPVVVVGCASHLGKRWWMPIYNYIAMF